MGLFRSLLWILPIGSLLSVAAARPLSPTAYRILKPGPVIKSGNDRFELRGSFTVVPDPHPLSLQETSHGSGGACIFGDLAEHGAPELSCTTNSQCSAAWASYHDANLGNPSFDAAAFGSVGNGACVANRCLYRPAPGVNACVRSPAALAVGHHKFGPFSLDHVARMFGDEARIDWQVVTCANRAQLNGTDAPSCPQGIGIYRPGNDE